MCIDKPCVSRSMQFGKFGGRCKSLQRGISWTEGFYFSHSSDQSAEDQSANRKSPSAFTAGEVRGLCPPAFEWPPAIVRSSLTTATHSPPNEKTQRWCSGEGQNPDLIDLFLSAKLRTRSSPGPEASLPPLDHVEHPVTDALWTSQTTITQNHNESACLWASKCFDWKTGNIKKKRGGGSAEDVGELKAPFGSWKIFKSAASWFVIHL